MTTNEFENVVWSALLSHCLLGDDNHVLVALSGGADSVALLRVLLRLGIDVSAVHFNHHLRGEEATRDERFVRQLCHVLGVELRVVHLDVHAHTTATGASVEMAARELRYRWLELLCDEMDCDVIAVAHHGDDNVETVLLNALRGAGVRGLAGMRYRRGRVVRPLLGVRRRDIIAYLRDIGQDRVEDSTNACNDALRNRLRNVVIPTLEGQFDNATARLLRTIDNVGRGVALYDELVANAVAAITTDVKIGDVTAKRIDLRRLCEYRHRATLLHEMLAPHGFNESQLANVLRGAECGVKGVEFSSFTSTLMLDCETADLVDNKILKHHEEIGEIPLKESLEGAVAVMRGEVPFDKSMVDGREVIVLPASVFNGSHTMVLRHRREGDRMAPYGMRGTKLVSDIFAERHLTGLERRLAWLLVIDGEVAWALGCRASRLCHVEQGSTDYVLLSHVK